jgi:folate-binding protein YgfZ
MKKSNLQYLHEELGGIFLDGNHSQTPDYYTKVEDEIVSVRNKMGIVDLTGRGKLKISGRDHLKLLQGMLTNDMIKLEVGKGNYAAALTVKGKMLADIRAFKFSDFILFDLEPRINIILGEHLTKFKLSYKADIDDLTGHYSHFHLCGPESAEFLESIFKLSTAGMNEYDFKTVLFNETEIYIIKINRTGETGFDLIAQIECSNPLWQNLLREQGNSGLNPFGKIALNSMRIEAGIPVFGIDMDENTIPIEAGLWNALDFDKGCYIGQEVIARIKWRGRVNWHLTGFESREKTAIPEGSKVYNENKDKEIGRITSSTFSEVLGGSIALGYIRREYMENGQSVLINSSEKLFLTAKVSELPFINNFN